MPQPSAWTRSDSSWLAWTFGSEALATLRILPRSGRIAWVSRSRACLAEPPAESPSTMKISVPSDEFRLQSASLPGRRSLRVACLRLTSFSCLRRRSARRRVRSPSPAACWRRPARPRASGRNGRGPRSRPAAALPARQPLLGLALELRIADEQREHDRGGRDHVVGRDRGRLAVADQLAVAPQALGQRRAQARLRGCRPRASARCCSRSWRSRRYRPARRWPIRPVPTCPERRPGRRRAGVVTVAAPSGQWQDSRRARRGNAAGRSRASDPRRRSATVSHFQRISTPR